MRTPFEIFARYVSQKWSVRVAHNIMRAFERAGRPIRQISHERWTGKVSIVLKDGSKFSGMMRL